MRGWFPTTIAIGCVRHLLLRVRAAGPGVWIRGNQTGEYTRLPLPPIESAGDTGSPRWTNCWNRMGRAARALPTPEAPCAAERSRTRCGAWKDRDLEDGLIGFSPPLTTVFVCCSSWGDHLGERPRNPSGEAQQRPGCASPRVGEVLKKIFPFDGGIDHIILFG